jgi:hypothetical protein
MAQRYGIAGWDEALAYLREPVLRGRLLAATEAVVAAASRGVPLDEIMGGRTDTLKLVSSLTLFGAAAEQLQKAENVPQTDALASLAEILLRAAEQLGYPRCRYTREAIAKFTSPN